MTRTAVKFGVFGAVCIAITVWLAFTIGNIQLFQDRYQLVASFDDVTGLLPSDNVKIAGVRVGKVTGIEVDEGHARVTFEVDSDYELPTDSTAAIRWRNLIGQRYLYVYPGSASTMLTDGEELPATESVIDLGELFNKLGPIVAAVDEDKVNEFLDTVSQALNGNEDKIRQTIDDLAVLAGTLAGRDETIGRLIENLDTVAGTITSRDQQIRTMLDNLVALSQAFSDNTDVLDQALVQFGRFSTDLNSILTNNQGEIDNLLNNLDLVVQTVGTRIGTLEHAVFGDPGSPRDGLVRAAEAIFKSSGLGQWLNQNILCVGLGPPPAGANPACTVVNDTGDLLGLVPT
ncbi:MAG: MlaD family protein, partial [Acidimicrobiales bacterium]